MKRYMALKINGLTKMGVIFASVLNGQKGETGGGLKGLREQLSLLNARYETTSRFDPKLMKKVAKDERGLKTWGGDEVGCSIISKTASHRLTGQKEEEGLREETIPL